MAAQTHKQIFRNAWRMTVRKKHRRLVWYGFVPALFTTTLSTFIYSLKGFQYWVELFQGERFVSYLTIWFGEIVRFISTNIGLSILLLFLLIIFGVGYTLIPIVFQAGLIKMLPKVLESDPFTFDQGIVDKAKHMAKKLVPERMQSDQIKFRMGLVHGAKYFFKMFQFKAAFSPFRFTWPVLAYWVIRLFFPEILLGSLLPLGIWLLIDVIATLMFLFGPYFIILRDGPVFSSIKNSTKMVFLNLEEIIYALFLILIIEARVIFNTILVFAIPAFIMFLGGLVASTLIGEIATLLGVLVGLAMLFIIAYINGVINVFITSSWFLFFLRYEKLTPKEEE